MNPPANARDIRDTGSIPKSGRIPGRGHDNPLQYSCLGNPMDRAWQATVHGPAKSQTQLKWLSTSKGTFLPSPECSMLSTIPNQVIESASSQYIPAHLWGFIHVSSRKFSINKNEPSCFYVCTMVWLSKIRVVCLLIPIKFPSLKMGIKVFIFPVPIIMDSLCMLLYYYCCSITQSCMTLCDPIDCSLPSSFVHGIFQARILEWVDIFFSRWSSWPKDQTYVSWVYCICRWILYHWATWDALYCVYSIPNKFWWLKKILKISSMLETLRKKTSILEKQNI